MLILPPMLLMAALFQVAPTTVQAEPPASPGVERQLLVMGTSATLVAHGEGLDAPRMDVLAATEPLLRSIEAAEVRLSNWNPHSEVSRFQTGSAGEWTVLSPELDRDLRAAFEVAEETSRAFDPLVGPLVDAWRLRSGGARPSQGGIDEALRLGLPGQVVTGEKGWRLESGARIATGGFGKGAALADVLRLLPDSGLAEVRLNLGGQWLFYARQTVGTHAGGFAIDIAHPDHRDQTAVTLRVPAGSIATSGNSERGIAVNGVSYGHLLDPTSGVPVADFGSVTVWSPDPLRADAWSTALFVLGPELGLTYAQRAPDIEALFHLRDGNKLRVLGTSRMAQWICATPHPIEAIEVGASNSEQGGALSGSLSASARPKTLAKTP